MSSVTYNCSLNAGWWVPVPLGLSQFRAMADNNPPNIRVLFSKSFGEALEKDLHHVLFKKTRPKLPFNQGIQGLPIDFSLSLKPLILHYGDTSHLLNNHS